MVLADFIKDCLENNREIVLVSGRSERVKDIEFTIADNVAVNYFLNKVAGHELTVEEKVKRFSEELVDLSRRFIDVLEDLIGDLLSEFALRVED
jgi:hypothetical protein